MKRKLSNKKEREADMLFTNMAKEVTNQIEDAEEKVVKDVLRNLLKREPTEEDGKRCIRAFEKGVKDRYSLIYAGVDLGIVHIEIKNKEVSIRFIAK